MVVDTSPHGAEIWMNGVKACGCTPCDFNIREGSYNYKAVISGYPKGAAVRKGKLTISFGRRNVVKIPMDGVVRAMQ